MTLGAARNPPIDGPSCGNPLKEPLLGVGSAHSCVIGPLSAAGNREEETGVCMRGPLKGTPITFYCGQTWAA